MRERIYNIIEPGSQANKAANIYDFIMVVLILLSFLPLVVKEPSTEIRFIDLGTALIFAGDYVLRWMTADFKLKKQGPASFIRYPITPMAIIDLLSILPPLLSINSTLKLFRMVRLMRALRVLRIVRIFRYSRNIRIIGNVFRRQKHAFIMVLMLTIGYIFVSAAILFQIEPYNFENFFDAVYWAVILLTTVGYGDIIATTMMGKMITVISALAGVAVVALPAGMITAGYLNEINREEDSNEKKDRDVNE